MKMLPQKQTLRKSVLLYRRIRHRKGYGVHSPFVYNLITKVIEEKHPYYHFYDIELIRKQLRFKDDIITILHNGKIRNQTIADIVEREAIRPKHGALLFRLTNYFKSKSILQIGPSMGLSTLYLTSYAPGLTCTSLENIPEYASISRRVYDKAARTSIDLRIGAFKELLPDILKDMGSLDFVYFNTRNEQNMNMWLFNECINYICKDTVFVFEGIKANRCMRECWKEICSHPEVTVTMDLFSMGIVFFNKKLHKRNYTVYF